MSRNHGTVNRNRKNGKKAKREAHLQDVKNSPEWKAHPVDLDRTPGM